MRKFKRFPPRSLWFRLLLILAGALMLLAAVAPRANADCPACIRFYDFETPMGGSVTPPFPVNLDSHMPAFEQGMGTTLFLDNGTFGMAYDDTFTSAQPGIPMNYPAMGALPNMTSIGFNHSGFENLGVEIPMTSAVGIYDVTSVSFAYFSDGNGWAFVTLQYSTDGGTNFQTMPGTMANTPLPATGSSGSFIVFNGIPAGTTLNQPDLILRLLFTGGQSNGANLQFELDNIQINGTIVPEPATVAGGLLGVLGLCWFQRRRLIRSVRFRRA
jgi:hypothetical protein